MKKYMVADLIKDLKSELIARAQERYNLNDSEAERFVDNFPNESTWADVEETANALEVDITDVEDDDVENVMSAGEAKGEIESSLGKVFYWYSIALGTYILTTVFDKGNPAQYPISVSELQDIRSSESFGEYFNKNIRANPEYSDKPGACGCIGDDPDKPKRLCTSEDFANMPSELREYVSRFVAIS